MEAIKSKSQNGTISQAASGSLPRPFERPVCHYLGLVNDKETWLSFSSPGNFCHFVNKIEAPSAEHQQAYCLSVNHLACPVLELQNRKRLPEYVAFKNNPTGRSAWLLRVLAAILVIILILVVALLFFRPALTALGSSLIQDGGNGSGLLSGVIFPQGPAGTPSPLPAAVVLAEPTHAPTSTSQPTPSATSPPPPTITATLLPPPASPTIIAIVTAVLTATLAEPAATSSPTPNPPQIVVVVSTLNIRSGPGIDYPIIATIDQGIQMDLTGRTSSSGWLLICCLDNSGTPGWVFSESVLVEGEVSDVPVINNIAPPPPTVTP